MAANKAIGQNDLRIRKDSTRVAIDPTFTDTETIIVAPWESKNGGGKHNLCHIVSC
jgi:hypothetical protein